MNFEVKENESITIFGPSSSGKSILLHLLRGLDRPDEVDVLMNETDILKLNDTNFTKLRLAEIGFVFQLLNLLRRLTALRNGELPLKIAGTTVKETSERPKEMLRKSALSYGLAHTLSNLIQPQQ